MQINRSDLADCVYFVTIARHLSFRQAGLELGVSTSALSHAIKLFEARLGVRLFNRNNRSVTLTAAGEQLLGSIDQPFSAMGEAFESLNQFREVPSGRVRLNIMVDAASLLVGPVLPIFMERYPEIELDIAVDNRMVDVVKGGYDAGIRYGGTVPDGMIAQRISADIDWVVVAAPAYLERFGEPRHPADLHAHRCFRIRLGNGSLYKWELDRGTEHFALDVPGPITVDHVEGALSAVLGGGGLMYLSEPSVRPLVREGKLKIVMPEWASRGEAFHVYYSSRRNLPAGLRLLIELIREVAPLGY